MTLDNIAEYHCPRWAQLPGIPLYMDQVVLVLDEWVGAFADERGVTSTMINNYVKQKLISPPEKKKYGREQLAMLVVLSIMKRVLSMSEIVALVELMTAEAGIEAAYDTFAEKLEEMLRTTFAEESRPAASKEAGAALALGAALTALGGKLRLQQCLAGHMPPAPPAKQKPPREKSAKK